MTIVSLSQYNAKKSLSYRHDKSLIRQDEFIDKTTENIFLSGGALENECLVYLIIHSFPQPG